MSIARRVRRFLTALGLGYLGLAAWNGRIYRRTRNLRFPLPLEGDTDEYNWPGGRIHFTQRGRRGEPLLLVHGIYAGADSYEFRQVFAPLAERYQVYAYDLLGFGHSARPDLRYSGPLYVRLLADFVRDVIRRPTAVIATSLSGGHAIRAADEERNLIQRLILESPTGRTATSAYSAGANAAYLAFNMLPDLGEAAVNLIASRPSIRGYLRSMAFHNRQSVTDELVEYLYRSAHQPGARHALVAFLAGRLNVPVEEPLRQLPQPVSLFWGRQARVTPLNQAWRYLTARPDATLHVLDGAGLDAINDQPEAFVRQTLAILAGEEVGAVSEQALEKMAPQRA